MVRISATTKSKEITGEYVITDNPIDGRLVVVHYKDGSQAIVHS